MNDSLTDLKRASEIMGEIAHLDNIINSPKIAKPHISTLEEYSGVSKLEFCFDSIEEFCVKKGYIKKINKPKYDLSFWDDAKKMFTIDFFKNHYGIFSARSNKQNASKECPNKYKGTKIGRFISGLNNRYDGFYLSVKLKAPKIFYKEFLSTINGLEKEWLDYEEYLKKIDSHKEEYEESLCKAKQEFEDEKALKMTQLKESYDEYYAKATKNYDAYYEMYLQSTKTDEESKNKKRELEEELNQILKRLGISKTDVYAVKFRFEKQNAKSINEALRLIKEEEQAMIQARREYEASLNTYIVLYQWFNGEYWENEQCEVKAEGKSNAIDKAKEKIGMDNIKIYDVLGD